MCHTHRTLPPLPLMQVFVTASASMRAGSLAPAQCRACKYTLNTLMNIFSGPTLPAGIGASTLAELVRVLLLRLVDDGLSRMAEGEALLKVCGAVQGACVCLTHVPACV